MTNTNRTKWIIASTFAVVLSVGASTAGYAVASNLVTSLTASPASTTFLPSTSSTSPEQQAYEAGTRNARVDFCNLRFDKDKPTVDDPRTYDGLPGSVVVADDVCDPNFVAQWNDAQESAGSDKRACIIDRTLEGIVGRYFCTAPSTVTY
jgi:hypothetical protein